LTTETIDWNNALSPIPSETLSLGEAVIDEPHVVIFDQVKALENGAIVATVECETLSGTTLWLRSERYGPQNGLASLVKAADGGEHIETNAFIYTKVASEKSPAGYAHRWQPEPQA
tara:strand:+ start:172 stop:519 length:348 start_codon:yes stop_codon:yes gene_type:complete